MESRSLVKMGGPRIPEVLGSFHLDDHNVEEWSDSTNPAIRHNARKEIGKWINLENNADIKYQKREDVKQSDRSKEQIRTEVIEGQAPDSTFQIVRSQSHFQDVGNKANDSRVQTTTTSYQISSSRGVKSTSKSTSNRTTTKTASTSGVRTDDFEHLNMSFQPLDTSRQREKINVSRSGTMGVRRPPTRRHTPAAILSSSPEDNIDTRDDIIVDSDDNMRATPDFTRAKVQDQAGLSIIGFKNISPKIRVGFPVEIQLELQTKLRSSSHAVDRDEIVNTVVDDASDDRKNGGNGSGSSYYSTRATLQNTRVEQIEKEAEDESAIPLFQMRPKNEDIPFDFKQRRKSYGFESFDSHVKQSETRSQDQDNMIAELSRYSKNSRSDEFMRNEMHLEEDSNELTESPDLYNDSSSSRLSSHFSRLSPSYISRSWDLIQSAANAQQRREENKKLFKVAHDYSYQPLADIETSQPQVNSFQPTTVNLNHPEDYQQPHTIYNDGSQKVYQLEFETESPTDDTTFFHRQEASTSTANLQETEIHSDSAPDVLHHKEDDLSPSLERSRKLLRLLDETPDLLHKMSYKNFFVDGLKTVETNRTDDPEEQPDWETHRQLSFLNDSLTRILEDGKKLGNISADIESTEVKDNLYERGLLKNNHLTLIEEQDNYNLKNKVGQVSHTWISSGDPKKLSQKVRDNDVITSISATNDPFKRGPKKVEFCKTEVHFTTDSGKFHIVETDENKPSTSHLFRRKKRGDRTRQSLLSSSSTFQNIDISEATSTSSNFSNPTQESGIDNKNLETILNIGSNMETQPELNNLHLVKSRNPELPVHDGPHLKQISNSLIVNRTLNSENTLKTVENFSNPKSLPMLALLKERLNNENDEVFESSQIIMDKREEDFSENMQSPSHLILSNYGEMKIQRYLKQLKPPSSQNGSDSPTGSISNIVAEDDHPSHFRFDNVLYEHGSFVPLATRRSLIEMNNRNRKRHSNSHVSETSSTASTYSLPHSDRETSSGNQPFRLAKLEAKVATGWDRPRITSVELSYELDSKRPYNPEPVLNWEKRDSKSQENTKSSNISPSSNFNPPVGQLGESFYVNSSPPNEHLIKFTTASSAKPPTSALPMSYEESGRRMNPQQKLNRRNSSCRCYKSQSEADCQQETHSHNNTLAMTASSITSQSHSKGSSKSIVTIGDYDTGRWNEQSLREVNEQKVVQLSPEPVLSMDHTWKGPAAVFDDENDTAKNMSAISTKSSTYLKSLKSTEPEWVSKARNRETRMTDWDRLGKQSELVNPLKTEPPWMGEIIRFRSKSTTSDEGKAVPKISIVYPWQRESERVVESVDDGEIEENEIGRSQIVSIVPAPSAHSLKSSCTLGSRSYYSKSAMQSGPKSSEISMIQSPSKEIEDRDSDSILIHPTLILKQKEFEAKSSRSSTKYSDHPQVVSLIVKRNKDVKGHELAEKKNSDLKEIKTAKVSSTSGRNLNPKERDTKDSKTERESSSKDLKPPKPPLRASSLKQPDAEPNKSPVKASTRPINVKNNTIKEPTKSRKSVGKQSEVDKAQVASRSNTPIHCHPTVQVSKLPIRQNNVTMKVADGKPNSSGFGSRTRSKDKHQVTFNSETKQTCVPHLEKAASPPEAPLSTLKSRKSANQRMEMKSTPKSITASIRT